VPFVTDSVRARFLAPLDVVLLAVLVGAGCWSTWTLFQAPEGGRAVVWIDGKRQAWYPIDGAPAVDTIAGRLGPVLVHHGDGAIRILEAPCPGKLCVRQGAAHRVGEKLVCVPSRVVVSIEGDAESGEVLDAVH